MPHALSRSAGPPPPPEATPAHVILLPLILGAICTVTLIAACIQRSHLRTSRRRVHEALEQQQITKERLRSRTIEMINDHLQRVIYCFNQVECEPCRQNQECKTHHVVRVCCKEKACDNACPDQGRGVDEGCVICLADYNDGDELRVLPCRHFFHAECADKWLASPDMPGSDRTCPTCKAVALRVPDRVPDEVPDEGPDEQEPPHRRVWRERVREATEAAPAPMIV